MKIENLPEAEILTTIYSFGHGSSRAEITGRSESSKIRHTATYCPLCSAKNSISKVKNVSHGDYLCKSCNQFVEKPIVTQVRESATGKASRSSASDSDKFIIDGPSIKVFEKRLAELHLHERLWSQWAYSPLETVKIGQIRSIVCSKLDGKKVPPGTWLRANMNILVIDKMIECIRHQVPITASLLANVIGKDERNFQGKLPWATLKDAVQEIFNEMDGKVRKVVRKGIHDIYEQSEKRLAG